MSDSINIEKNLKVLVTAGAGGIGRVIAEKFHELGARIFICDNSETALAECASSYPSWGFAKCDVSKSKEVDILFDSVEKFFGGLDVLINNAGIAGPTSAIEDMVLDDWNRTIEINLNGQFYCARRAIPMLKKSNNASLICISSVAGRLGYAFRTPYAATKWAIIGLMKSLAIELGPDGIRVNAILPGIVEGPRIDAVIEARSKEMNISFKEMEKQMIDKVSLRKMVTSEDVANQAVFLCSSLGRNISGQPISVCGNVEVL
ncbi:MAG: SDR family oxidoreductase [Proteobacteria bacterium]|jgi:NAD(P)-dependent dehydrogenase (short-subunit alcohol dehydrogenase family)|nr:SDR family oxidoreductase [Pseudomonadota bacterium]